MEKSFLQNEGGYRDGSKHGKVISNKQGVISQLKLHDTIPTSCPYANNYENIFSCDTHVPDY